MTDPLAVAAAVLSGDRGFDDHPWLPTGELTEVADGTAFVSAFANVTALRTGDGLVLVDTGSGPMARHVHERVRGWSGDRLHTAVYTHGHIDHVFGVQVFEAESARARLAGARPCVAHEALPARFDRYRLTAGLQRGHQPAAVPAWPSRLADRLPLPGRDLPRRARPSRSAASAFELHHARGRDRRPHLGVGARAQGAVLRRPVHLGVAQLRQPAEGAALPARVGGGAARDGRRSAPSCCCPATACRIAGADRDPDRRSPRRRSCSSSLHDQTLELMNEGARLDEIAARPYGARRTCSSGRTCGRSTTSRSSSCATSGGCTAAGTTATRRTSSPRRRSAGRRARRARRAARAARRPGASAGRGRTATCGWPGTSRSWPRRPRRTTPACTRRARRCSGPAQAATSTMAKGVFAWAAAESEQRSGRTAQ